jgi:hypothetical protein
VPSGRCIYSSTGCKIVLAMLGGVGLARVLYSPLLNREE